VRDDALAVAAGVAGFLALAWAFQRGGASLVVPVGSEGVDGETASYPTDRRLTRDEVARLAADTIAAHGFNVEPAVAVAVAEIESSRDPRAVRWEPALGDASTGLMQVLGRTATWLASIGYGAFGSPGYDDMLRPEVSMYLGCAYLDYLSRYGGQGRDLEFVVRAYNGGPGGVMRAATLPYWRKFLAAYDGG
jgi:soluble lytic murein transglycosylase-like protein